MVLLRALTNLKFQQLTRRLYAKKSTGGTSVKHSNMIQVHQETLRQVHPRATFNIKSDVFVKVRSIRPEDYMDNNVFIAELHGDLVSNTTTFMTVRVSEDEQQIDIELTKTAEDTKFYGNFILPITADVRLHSNAGAKVSHMYNSVTHISAHKDINTKDINAEHVFLLSEAGNISCSGLLLGKRSAIETKGEGHVFLEKLQGDQLSCKTAAGNINTKCCYVETSKFETDTGALCLNNIHKTTEVRVHKEGDLKMSGVNGNICIDTNGGTLNVQLSQIVGHSSIIALNNTEAIINVSDDIVKLVDLELKATAIELDSSLEPLQHCLSEDKKMFSLVQPTKTDDILSVCCSNGGIKFGKSSWAQSLANKFGYESLEKK